MRSLIPFFLMAALLPAQSQQVQAALAAGSYFPLEVGNRWVYSIDKSYESRAYETWSVDRAEEHDGRTYFVVAIRSKGSLLGESLFRVDDGGRVFLRPTPRPNPAARRAVQLLPSLDRGSGR